MITLLSMNFRKQQKCQAFRPDTFPCLPHSIYFRVTISLIYDEFHFFTLNPLTLLAAIVNYSDL